MCISNSKCQHIRLWRPGVGVFSLGTVKLGGRSMGDTAALTCSSLVEHRWEPCMWWQHTLSTILYEKGSAQMCHNLSTWNQGYMNRGNQKHKIPKYKVHQEYIDNLRKCKIALCKGLHMSWQISNTNTGSVHNIINEKTTRKLFDSSFHKNSELRQNFRW